MLNASAECRRRRLIVTSVHERIADARQALVRAGLDGRETPGSTPRCWRAMLSAGIARGWSPTAANRCRPTSSGDFAALIERRATREPVAFITGQREFWGLDFDVSPDVLIPRPETELIVEAVCERAGPRAGRAHDRRCRHRQRLPRGRAGARVPGGTGARHRHLRRRAGCRRQERDPPSASIERVTFVRGDLLEPVQGPVDVIVSNPPYVPAGVELSPDIVRFEPSVALYSGARRADARRSGSSSRARIAPARRTACS